MKGGSSVDRRTFLESSLMAAGGAMLSPWPALAADPPMLGIQVGAVSFVDEGTDTVLDNLREMAAINTLFLATFTYGRGIAGRQPRGNPLPDHGKQEYDDDYHGGNFATPHPQFYRGTTIAPEKAPDHPNYGQQRVLFPSWEPHALANGVFVWPLTTREFFIHDHHVQARCPFLFATAAA